MSHHEPRDCICTDVAPNVRCWCECHQLTSRTDPPKPASWDERYLSAEDRKYLARNRA